MIRYAVFVVIIVIGIYVSIYIDRQYKCRIRVYRDVKYILGMYKEDVIFSKDSFSKVLDTARLYISDYTYMLIYEYMHYKYIRYVFKQSDYANIYTFLDEVGSRSVDSEVARVKYYIHSVDEYISTLESDYDKNGRVYTKLILILSVLIAIVLL